MKNRIKSQKGITLVALVITIIIIIILATVSISAVFGDNGLIEKAEEAKDMTANSVIAEQEEMNELLTEYTNIMEGDSDIPLPEDTTPPTVEIEINEITKSSIAITINAVDTGSGLAATDTYKYYLDDEENARETSRINSYTYTGLKSGTSYTIKVEVYDKAGNKATKTMSVTTTADIGGAEEGLASGNIIASSPVWANGTASITLTTSTGLIIQYQVGGTAEGSWTTGTSVTGLNHNDKVYARLTDGTNYGNSASVTIIDGVAPTVTVTKGTVTTKSIAVSASATDSQWGMPTSPTYAYYIKTSSTGTYPTTATYSGTNASYTFNNLVQNTSYDIKVTTKDKANNTGSKELKGVTTGTVGGAGEGLVTGNIVASSPTWSGGTASIKLSTNTGLTIQYQVGGIAEGSWKTGTSVTGLEHNDTVYARLTDGTNYGDYASVTILDGIAPNAPTISLSGTTGDNGWYRSNVTVKIKAGSDGQSGANKVRYKVTGAQIVSQTDTPEGTTSKSITISTNGTSTITAYTIDKAGNVSSEKTQVVNKDTTAPSAASLSVGIIGETSIQVTANGSDSTSGVYSYQFQRSTTSSTSGFTTVETKTSSASSYSYTYSSLTAGTTYYLRVIVTDKAGNTKTGTAITQATIISATVKLKVGNTVVYPSPKGDIHCKVLYDDSSVYGLQLVATSNVKDVKLGVEGDFEASLEQYNNAISILNNIANEYINSDYSSFARCVGTNPENLNWEAEWYPLYGRYDYIDQIRAEDENYEMDETQMEKIGAEGDYYGPAYWMGSRRFGGSIIENGKIIPRQVGFALHRHGVCNTWDTVILGLDGGSSKSKIAGFRPVFSLKPEVIVTGGNGYNKPYTLGL